VEIANRRAGASQKDEDVDFKVKNFMDMDFSSESFDFVLDIGCFHHVVEEDRSRFIKNVHRVLRQGGRYLLMCFSEGMGRAWNHFSERQIRDLFTGHFNILTLDEISSVEGDGVTRKFHVSLMERSSE